LRLWPQPRVLLDLLRPTRIITGEASPRPLGSQEPAVERQELLNRLLKLQEDLRNRLVEELCDEGDELDDVFSPTSFSNKYEGYRYKFTERLDTLNRIINEIQRAEQPRPTFKVACVEAPSREDLVVLINKRLAKMRPAQVSDLRVFRDRNDDRWVAIVVCGY